MILAIRTDKPEAELYVLDGSGRILNQIVWTAHRQLAETLHHQIQTLLKRQRIGLKDITKVAVYKGPGSFTGLRIGMSVANALAYGLGIPIVAETGENWLELVVQSVGSRAPQVPLYGADVHTTQQKK